MKPHMVHLEDGSLLVKWIGKNARFGITIENELTESGWFYVSWNEQASGMLPWGLLEYLAERLRPGIEQERT